MRNAPNCAVDRWTELTICLSFKLLGYQNRIQQNRVLKIESSNSYVSDGNFYYNKRVLVE